MVTMLPTDFNGCVALGATDTVKESIVSLIDQLYPRGLPTMFRRRTDQVYSTLQQVQRRITEQNGGQSDLGEVLSPTQPIPSITLQPLSQALPQTLPHTLAQTLAQTLPQVMPSGALQPFPVAQPPQPFAGFPVNRMTPTGHRYVLQISGDLAMLLVVVWLVSMAVMFFIGHQIPSSGGAGFAAGTPGNRETSSAGSVAKRQGDWIYILESRSTTTVEVVNAYEQRARELNDFVAKNPTSGWKAYFGVRKPDNGGLELVFGQVDRAVFGIDKSEFEAFAKMLSQPTSKNGAGYASARWVKVTP